MMTRVARWFPLKAWAMRVAARRGAVSSYTRSPPISAISCARWRRPSRSRTRSLTSLKEKLIKIGAKVVSHSRYLAFPMAEVAVRMLFAEILRLIAELRPRSPPIPA
jgi:hypothetical protein